MKKAKLQRKEDLKNLYLKNRKIAIDSNDKTKFIRYLDALIKRI
jgi:hypothetical protein